MDGDALHFHFPPPATLVRAEWMNNSASVATASASLKPRIFYKETKVFGSSNVFLYSSLEAEPPNFFLQHNSTS